MSYVGLRPCHDVVAKSWLSCYIDINTASLDGGHFGEVKARLCMWVTQAARGVNPSGGNVDAAL